VIGTMAGENR